jgi:hypothetical protein
MWKDQFTERERKEIEYCLIYQRDFGHGTDGHNIRLIVAKLVNILEEGVVPSGEDVAKEPLSQSEVNLRMG